MKKKISLYTEHQIQTQCINYLRATGWYVERINSGKMAYSYKGVQRFMQLAQKGTPDLLAFRPLMVEDEKIKQVAKLYFVEIKKPGNEPTLDQVMKMNELEEHGATCIVVHSLEELQEQL